MNTTTYLDMLSDRGAEAYYAARDGRGNAPDPEVVCPEPEDVDPNAREAWIAGYRDAALENED